MSDSPITLLVVEDNALTRLGIKSLLAAFADVHVAGVANSGVEGLALYAQTRPQVVMMDMKMPVLDGVDAIRLLLKQDASARVLVLSNYEGEEDVFRALDAGAMGYITKDDPAADILAAIRAVARGVRHLPPRLYEKWRRRQSATGLSPRERRVLELIGRGLSNKDIGLEQEVSVKTIEKDVKSILDKLGAANRAEAVAEGIRRGIIDAHI